MSDLSSDLLSEMQALAARLGPAPGAVGRRVQFVSADTGEGTSTLARAFAATVAERSSRPVWLVELDLMKGEQYDALSSDPESWGRLGEPLRASPDGSIFFRVLPRDEADTLPDGAFLAAHRVGESNLYVTRFRRERLSPGQSAVINQTPDYWRALSAHSAWVVVDAPAWSRSRAAAVVAPNMDANLMVVSARSRDPEAALSLRDAVDRAGGDWAGVVVNRAPKPPPRLLRGLTG